MEKDILTESPIINLDGEILFSAKLNSKFSNRKEREAYQALVGQNFFDVFENLER